MPVYKNNTARTIHWKGLSWGPGMSRMTSVFLPPQLELTKTDDEPLPPSPVLVAEKVVLEKDVPQSIEVPYSPRVKISAQTIGDKEALLTVNGKDVLLTPLIGWVSVPVRWEMLGVLTLSATEAATVYLIVEALE